jgi:hypothetical protein
VIPRPGGDRLRLAVALGLGLLLVVLAWPDAGRDLFPDSIEYLRWPEPVKTTGVARLGPRLPGYPLLLQSVGHDVALVQLQSWLSLGAWAWLGWLLAGPTGMFLSALVSLSPEIRYWNFAVLTESPTISLFVLIVALGLQLARGWRWWIFGAWALCIALFGLLRSSNLIVLPFVLAPLLPQAFELSGRPFGWLRPRETWPRLAAAAGVVAVVFLTGWTLTERSELWRMNYDVALLLRVQPDAEAMRYFEERGMPASVDRHDEAFQAWFDSRARRTYEAWVLGRGASWWEALPGGLRFSFAARM